MSKVVRIGGNPSSHSYWERFYRTPIAPLYFIIGILVGIVGVTYLGVHLWMVREGALSATAQYGAMRRLHALLQIHGFFGAFISGFALQAAPRLLGSSQVRPRWSSVLPFLLVAGLLMIFIYPNSSMGSIMISIHFACIAVVIGNYARRADRQKLLHVGLPFLVALVSLSIGALRNLSNPQHSFIILWLGVTPVILASLQQVFRALVGMKEFSNREQSVLLICYLGVGIFWMMAVNGYAKELEPWRGVALCNAVIFLLITKVFVQGAKESRPTSYAIAVGCWIATLWLGLCSVVLLDSTTPLDTVLHIFAIGFVFPIVMVVSTQIMGALSGTPLLRPILIFTIVLGWQIVAIGRGLSFYLPHSTIMTWTVPICATLILTLWSVPIGARALQVLRKKF